MIKKQFTINASTGLHARPAAIFVELASEFEADIKIEFQDQQVNAKSIISVLSLGLGDGETFNLKVKGPDEKQAMAALEEYMNTELGSEEENYNDLIGQDFKEIN